MDLTDRTAMKELFGTAWHLVEQRDLQLIFQEIEGLTDSNLNAYIRNAFPRADAMEYKRLRQVFKRLERELPPSAGMMY